MYICVDWLTGEKSLKYIQWVPTNNKIYLDSKYSVTRYKTHERTNSQIKKQFDFCYVKGEVSRYIFLSPRARILTV